MSGVSYPLAFFIGAFAGCVLYGLFVCLFFAACYVQWERLQKGRRLNRIMVFSTAFFGLTLTTNCILQLNRAIHAIVYLPPGVTISEFLSPPYPDAEIVWWGIFQLQIVVADIIMVYRMYHIYNRNAFMCVIPSVTIAGLLAVGCGLTNQLRDLTTPSDLEARNRWSTACFCLTLFNSVFTTVAIGLRLWFVHRETTRVGLRVKDSIILRTMRVLTESAALWTAFVAMDFLSFLANSNLRFTFLAMTGPAVGISFCLIIVRLGRILPGTRDETWHVSFRSPSTQTTTSDQVVVAQFAQVKIQKDARASESGSDVPTEISEPQGQWYPDSSPTLPLPIRSYARVCTQPPGGAIETPVYTI